MRDRGDTVKGIPANPSLGVLPSISVLITTSAFTAVNHIRLIDSTNSVLPYALTALSLLPIWGTPSNHLNVIIYGSGAKLRCSDKQVISSSTGLTTIPLCLIPSLKLNSFYAISRLILTLLP